MKKLFALFLAISINSIAAVAGDTLRVYTWQEALKADPETVLAITFEKMRLDTLPADLVRFKKLRKLDLSKNKFSQLPDFIDQLDSLQELNLHRNNITFFPMQICRMRSLKRLILSRNSFTQLPECIQYLKKLSYLDLSDTPVGSFPGAFVLMPQLKTLSLHGLAYPPSFQRRWKEKLPWMRIEFDPPCNCME